LRASFALHDIGSHDLRDDPGLRRDCSTDDRQHGELFIATRLQHEPIYEALAVQDGIHLPSGRADVRSIRFQPSCGLRIS